MAPGRGVKRAAERTPADPVMPPQRRRGPGNPAKLATVPHPGNPPLQPEVEPTPQERRAVERYLVHGSRETAMVEAGYSPGTNVAKVFTRARVQAYLRHLQMQLRDRAVGSAQRTLREMAVIAHADMGDYLRILPDGNVMLDFSAIPEGGTRAIKKVTQKVIMGGDPNDSMSILETSFELHDKLKALDMEARHLGLYRADNEQQGARTLVFDFSGLTRDQVRMALSAVRGEEVDPEDDGTDPADGGGSTREP